jgi:hypothetical protein
VLGAPLDGRHDMLVVEMPGFERPAWLDDLPRDDEQALLQSWKIEALQVCDEAQNKWGWCGDYARVMRGMGMR